MVAIRPSTLKSSFLRPTRSSTSHSRENTILLPEIQKNGGENKHEKPSLLSRRHRTRLTLSSELSISKKTESNQSVSKKSSSKRETSYPTPPTSSSLNSSYNKKLLKAEQNGSAKSKVSKKKGSNTLKEAVGISEACSCSFPPKRGRPKKNPAQCAFCVKESSVKKEKATNSAQALRAVRNKKIKNAQVESDSSSTQISNNKSENFRAILADTRTTAFKVSSNICKPTASKKASKILNNEIVVSLPKKEFVASKTPKPLPKSNYIKAKNSKVSDIEFSLKNPLPPTPITPKKVPALSEYEIKRLEIINQNKLFMESLNLGGGSSLSLSSISTPALPKPKIKYIKPPSSIRKPSVLNLAPRKSKRLQEKSAPRYSLPERFEEVKTSSRDFPTKLDSIKKGNKSVRSYNKIRNMVKKRAPQELDPEVKLYNIQQSRDENYIKKPLPEIESIDVSNFKDLSLDVHHIGTCLSNISLEDDFDTQVISRLASIKQVTSQPVKLIGPIPTTLDVHSDPQRFVVAMGNRAGEVAVWDATKAILGEGDECINKMGYLHEGASIMHHQAYEDRVWSLKFQPEYSAKLLQAGGDGSLRSFDIVKEHLSPVCQLPVHGEFMTGLGFVNPQTVAFTTSHGFFGHHDLRTSSHTHSLSALNNTAHLLWCLSVNPVNQHIIAVGSSERTLSIWDTRYLSKSEQRPVTELQFTTYVTSVDWDLHGKRLAVFAYDDVIRIFDSSNINRSAYAGENNPVEQSIVETAQYSHDADPWRKGVAVQARFHPDPNLDGRVVVAGAMGPKVNYYNSTSNRPLGYFDASHYPAASPGILAFHPKATLGSHPFGSGIVNGTLSGRVFILV